MATREDHPPLSINQIIDSICVSQMTRCETQDAQKQHRIPEFIKGRIV